MSVARFVTCPGCDRLMLGQNFAGGTYPQPHDCAPTTHRPEESPDE